MIDDNPSYGSLTASYFFDVDADSGNGNTPIASEPLGANCIGTDFSTQQTCNYSWNTSAIPEQLGGYYFYIVVSNEVPENGNAFSDLNFGVNNVAPTTTHNAPSATNSSPLNITLTCTDTGGSGCASIEYKLDSQDWASGTSPVIVTTAGEGTHLLQFYSIDNAGNTETTQSVNIIIDLTAPSLGSISLPDYTSTANPSFTLSATGANKMRFSCNGTDFSSPVDFATSYSGFNITNGTGCNSNNESKTIFVQFGDNAGNWNLSPFANDATIYDTTSPTTPTVDTTIDGSNGIRATWNTSSDSGSGIQKYEVRLDNGSFNDAGTSTSYTFNNVSNGSHTVYVRAVDRAGNTSNESSDGISVSSSCSISITITAPEYARPSQQISIKVEANNDLENADLTIDTESENKTLKDNYDGRSFTVTYTFKSGDEGTATLSLDAVDSQGRNCDASKEIIVDGTKPIIASFDNPKQGAELSEKTGIIFRARDDQSGVSKVDLHYRKLGSGDWIKITTINSSIGNLWSFPWNFKTLASGEYELRAIALDFADNESEQIITVKLSGTIADETPDDGTGETSTAFDELLSQSKILKNGVQQLMNFLKLVNIAVTEKISNDWSKANSKLLEANNSDDENKALEAAQEAKNLYTGLASMIQTSTETTQEYSFNADEMDSMLAAQGLTDTALLEQAKNYSQLVSMKRMLEIEKVVVDGKTFYTVGIVLTLKNNDNAEKNLKVIEIVPKEFAQNASNLSSEEAFIIINSDPIIQFNSTLAAGEEKEIKYYFSQPITKEQADAMIANNVIQSFKSPVILFNADQEVSAETFGAANSTPTGLFSGLNIDLSGLMFPIALIVGLIIVVFVFSFVANNNMGSRGSSIDSPLANPRFSTNLKRHENPTTEFQKKAKLSKWGSD
ncbi:MAG: fibronectin type III domain-containing protein [archaeon]|nr:fibronectin type III domain-containing protein [archaeon]